jgi:WD40 repeat protein
MTQQPGIIDARTDERWLRSVNILMGRGEWGELWKLAQKTPPIWTVRIVKYLKKQNWSPADDEQPEFFHKLSKFTASCNEFDLPGPEIPVANSRQLTPYVRIATARVTADGELLFVVDDKATAVEVFTLPDLNQVERIRLDMINGNQYAILGFAIDSLGNKLAVLTYEPKSQQADIHIYELEDGEVISDRWIRWSQAVLGTHVPRICFSGDGNTLATVSAPDLLDVWDTSSGRHIRKDKNVPRRPLDPKAFAFPIQPGSGIGDWRAFGRRALAQSEARSLAMSHDGKRILASHGWMVLAWGSTELPWELSSSTGEIAVSAHGKYAITLDADNLVFTDLIQHDVLSIANCADPLARFAVSEDSQLLALAITHSNCIKLWHLPDRRNLGTLFDLAHDALVDFRFTSSGSVVAVTRSGRVQFWEADGNGNAWPWSRELVQITHQPVDHSNVAILRQAQEMRRRGWLSVQESNLLDLALSLMQNRLNLDIEIEWESELPGDKYDIEID